MTKGRRPRKSKPKIKLHAPSKAPTNGLAIPKPPTLRDKHARAAWSRLIRILSAAGLMTEGDRDVCALFCDAWSQYLEMRTIVARDGSISQTDAGNLILHPAAIQEGRLRKDCLRLLIELGLTPSARAKVAAMDTNVHDPFMALISS